MNQTDHIMKWIFSFFVLLTTTLVLAQTSDLQGFVANEEDELLIGATVSWKGTTDGVTTDLNGGFVIPRREDVTTLIIQYVGYEPFNLEVDPTDQDLYITLSGVATLETIEVTEEEKGNYISTLGTRYVETISSNELKKAACCNLAESFETNASVDVGMTNAITGGSEVQMLGLRGIYTQLMVENAQH